MFKKYSNPLHAMVVLVCFLSSTAMAERSDVVVLINGNAVTGEVEGLEFGLLRYSTDSMGTVGIDWEEIVDVSSKRHLQIELADGTRYFGELSPTGDPAFVRVLTSSQEHTIESSRVVRITPIETSEKFFQRLDGSFSFGLQTQKSSEVTTSNLDADISYRTRHYLVGLRLNSSVTDQPKRPTKARQGASLNYQRFRPNRWFTDWFTSWEKNDELGVDGRVAAGGAIGRYVIQTNKNQLSLTGGVQFARTSFIPPFDLIPPLGEEVAADESETEAEGRIEIRYLRRNLAPETSIRFTSTIYPLLEDFSTYRAESNLSLSREIYEDFFIELGVGYSYISEPPTGGAKSDYTATTSFGYSF